jgi:hypothetical protein
MGKENDLETLYKGGRRRMMDLFCYVLCYAAEFLDLTDLSCGSWDTQLSEEW